MNRPVCKLGKPSTIVKLLFYVQINIIYMIITKERNKACVVLVVNNFHNVCCQLSKFCVLLSFNQAGFVLSFPVPEESEKQ